MPTYDWKCQDCGYSFEAVAPMSETEKVCGECILDGRSGGFNRPVKRQFSPNKNIMIPGHFRMDRGWHLPPEGSSAASPDANSRVHAKPRESFRQQFDKNWKAAGGS